MERYSFYEFQDDNFDFFITADNKTDFVGIALKDLRYEEAQITYTVKPSFHIAVDYNVYSHYQEAREKSLEIIENTIDCENEGNNLTDCLLKELVDQNSDSYNWTIDCLGKSDPDDNKQSRTYPLCLTYKQDKILNVAEKITKENPVLKFALYIADLPPAPIEGIQASHPPGRDKVLLLSW